MGNPRKKKRKPSITIPNSVNAGQPVAAPLMETTSPKGKLRRVGARLFSSAIDFVLGHIWSVVSSIVVGLVMTGVAFLLLYWRAGRAAWLYPWFTHAAVFLAGIVTLAVTIIGLAYAKDRARRREQAALENAKNLRFESHELGFVDFFANKEKAEAQLVKAILPINKEIRGLGKTATRQTRKVKPTTTFIRKQEILTETKIIFNEHSERLEKHWKAFAELDDILAESNAGCVNWLNAADDSHSVVLAQQRTASLSLLSGLDEALPSIQSFRQTVAAQHGQSQDFNTAVARLTFALDGLIGALRKGQSRAQNLITLVDRKTKH